MNLLSNHGNIIYKELIGKELKRSTSQPKPTPSLQGGVWFSDRDTSARKLDCPYQSSTDKPLSITCITLIEGKPQRIDTSRARRGKCSFKARYSSDAFHGDMNELGSVLKHIRDDELAAVTGKADVECVECSTSNSLRGDLDIYPAWNRHLPHN